MTIVVGFTPTPAGRAALLSGRQEMRGREASEEVLDVLESVDATLCVIGIRRRTAVGKMLMGSNAHRILMSAPCPVLAVKAADHA